MSKEEKTAQYCDLPYRKCVGITLFNSEGKVFVGERVDSPNAWQMPQGGIDDGETVHEAAFRELEEETGTNKAEIIKIHDEQLRYSLPEQLLKERNLWNGKYGGQEQTWVAMRFTGQDKDIDIHSNEEKEFSDWKWLDLHKTPEAIVPFKKDLYHKVVDAFQKYAKPEQ